MMPEAVPVPGNLGLPYLGETLTFLSNPFRFLEARQNRYGNVFKSRLLGRNIVFLAGLNGAEAFYDSQNISRADAHPFTLVDLFGGINMEMFDGPRHFALKSMALTAFDRTAIAGYLPDIEALIESTLQRLEQRNEFSAITELRKLAIAAIAWNVMGLPEGSATEAIARDYGLVLTGIFASGPDSWHSVRSGPRGAGSCARSLPRSYCRAASQSRQRWYFADADG